MKLCFDEESLDTKFTVRVTKYAGWFNQGAETYVCVSVPKECASVIRNRIVVLSVYTVQKNLGVCTV